MPTCFFQPVDAGHFAAAIEAVEAGEGVILADIAVTRHNHRDPGPHHIGLVLVQSEMPDQHTGDIRNGVQRSGWQVSNANAQVTKA